MRILAVDYGDARTGAAVSDRTGMIAGEAWTIHDWNEDRVIQALVQAAREKEVERFVVGYPRNMDGSAGPRAEKCAALAEKLKEASGLPVVLWDERRTTVDAHRILSENNRRGKKRKAVVDAVAATLILEGYLHSL